MSSPARPDDSRLDQYLDGRLAVDAASEYERAMRADSSLAKAAEQQARIDAALRSMFAPPTGAKVDDWCKAVQDGASSAGGRGSAARRTRRPLLAAAAIVLAAIGAYRIWAHFNPERGFNAYAPQAWRSFTQVYDDEVARGFEPAKVCTDDARFAAFVKRRFEQPLALAALPPGAEILGWSYSNSVSPRSTHILSRVAGTPVLVFVDLLKNERSRAPEPGNQLNQFRRELDPFVIYELTPLPEPTFLDLFQHPDAK